MDITELIRHPEQMDKETLYDLRSLLALHPYYQTARILLLQNLYLLHDQSFDEELRKAAVYITDRRVLFNIVEAAHYRLSTNRENGATRHEGQGGDRTISLIDNFLDSIPTEEQPEKSKKRKPTPADAAVDYVSYLLETESDEDANATPAPQLKGHDLIDNFIFNEGGKIQLKVEPDFVPDMPENGNEGEKDAEDGYFTETLAKIYIKQGRYSKALEIINRLNLNYPKKNAYFADQIRFLEKLIINNKTNK
ncbi:MAG: tetratricopeptide repeat protein [Prevotella sp.]